MVCKFRSADFSLRNEPRRKPNTSLDNDALKALLENDPRQTSRELPIKMDIHHSTMKRHLSSIGKVNKLDKWESHDFADPNRLHRY